MYISQRVIATKGRSTGFDYLRIFLAVAVVALHTIPVCYGWSSMDAVWAGPGRPLAFLIVPSFFALSGFLVSGSLERVDNIPVYLTLRFVRIFPALSCEVLLSALLVGPLLTNLPLGAYFSDHSFWAYMLNVFGDIHFDLAGVFSNNPTDIVNAQLWTIEYEIKCYLVLALLAILMLTKKIRLLGWATAILNVAAYCWASHRGFLAHWDRESGAFLIVSFLWGVFIYINRARVRYSGWLCLGAALVYVFAVLWSPETTYLTPLPIAYVTIYLGLQNPRKIWLIVAGDFSYGVYIYGWPVQQTIMELLPGYRVWYFNLVASLVVTFIFAWLSWTLVESKALARKRQATRFVDLLCTRTTQLWRNQWTLLRPSFQTGAD